MSRFHWFTATVPYVNTQDPDALITVNAGLHHIGSNRAPYFSVTADIPRLGMGGCLHDDVLTHWPELAPVVALHLAWEDGEPLHALANGRYHLGFGPYGTWNVAHAASHFRITQDEARALRERLALGDIVPDGSGRAVATHDEDALVAWVDAQRPRWKQEADDAIRLLCSLIASTATHQEQGGNHA